MKLSKNKMITAIISIVILIAALTLMIVDWAVPLELFTHPILNFLMVLFIGFGVMCLTYGFYRKSPWFFFLSAILLSFAIFYIVIQHVKMWWIVLIAVVVFDSIVAIVSFMTAGSQTEDIALNKSPDYKDYKQRKAEKEEKEAAEEKKELPKIKSFKD